LPVTNRGSGAWGGGKGRWELGYGVQPVCWAGVRCGGGGKVGAAGGVAAGIRTAAATLRNASAKRRGSARAGAHG